jgi:hypothetical protein
MTRRHLRSALAVGLAAGVLLLLSGCPVPSQNQNPVANAGADQTVNAGATVSLNGSASTDPDGDTLTFQWAQTAGTNVTLGNADTATPAFVAPSTAGVLNFELTVNDGRGGTDTDSVNVTVSVPANQNPVANAGPDQTVNTGATVSLNGSASTDPDGDALTFQWTQTAGTIVTLGNADTATPAFVAPNTAETLTFELAVNDGRGGTDTDSVDVNVGGQAPQQSILYITNFGIPGVIAYDITTPATVNGNITPDAFLAGGQTQLAAPSDLVVDGNGGLLVCNLTAKSITGYADALNLTSINGNVAPTRNVQGGVTGLAAPVSMAISTANDLVFVAEGAGGTVHVYANASTSALNGNVAPIRTITSADMNAPRGINFGANDELYVANAGTNAVSVFANASNLNGPVPASRVITSVAFVGLFDVFIDQNDTMFVVSGALGGNRIHVITNAATRNGVVSPDFTLTVVGAVNLTAIAVDSTGHGYIVDANNSAVYGYDNIATRNGAIVPDRTLKGVNTQLAVPLRVFLHE